MACSFQISLHITYTARILKIYNLIRSATGYWLLQPGGDDSFCLRSVSKACGCVLLAQKPEAWAAQEIPLSPSSTCDIPKMADISFYFINLNYQMCISPPIFFYRSLLYIGISWEMSVDRIWKYDSVTLTLSLWLKWFFPYHIFWVEIRWDYFSPAFITIFRSSLLHRYSFTVTPP